MRFINHVLAWEHIDTRYYINHINRAPIVGHYDPFRISASYSFCSFIVGNCAKKLYLGYTGKVPSKAL